MTTIAVDNVQNIQKHGEIYASIIGSVAILSDNAADLLVKLEQVNAEKISDLFGASSTWTFVESKFAEHWDAAEQLTTGNVRLPLSTPSHYLAHMTNVLRGNTPKEAIDAYEWVRDNAKGKVTTWKYPLTDTHYYLFEDANDAMLFKLSVTV